MAMSKAKAIDRQPDREKRRKKREKEREVDNNALKAQRPSVIDPTEGKEKAETKRGKSTMMVSKRNGH